MRRRGRLELPGREVHLWTVRLEAAEAEVSRCLTWLSGDEKARAARFQFDKHRRLFILGRSALRALLASYLGISAPDVNFSYGPHGKPALHDSSSPLSFNVSNSGDLAALVFTTGCQIGVDVEQYRPVRDLEAIAHRFFSPEEAAELLEIPEVDRPRAFFNCWTRKEAYIKAMGGGLSIPLSSFRVTLRPGDPAKMVLLDGNEPAAREWTLHNFTPAADYAGAVAFRDAPRLVNDRSFPSFGDLLEELGSS